MQKTILIAGFDDTAQFLWEASSLHLGVEFLGFVRLSEPDYLKHFLGSPLWAPAAIKSLNPDILFITPDAQFLKAELQASAPSSCTVVCVEDEDLPALLSRHIGELSSQVLPLSTAPLNSGGSQPIRVAIFGAATGGIRLWLALSFCRNLELLCFLDSNPQKQGLSLFSTPILAPQSILEKAFDYILIGSAFWAQIQQQLLDMEIPSRKIVRFNSVITVQSVVETLSPLGFLFEEGETLERLLHGKLNIPGVL